MSEEKTLKQIRDDAIKVAEDAAYKYFSSVHSTPYGSLAHDVYTNIRNARSTNTRIA